MAMPYHIMIAPTAHRQIVALLPKNKKIVFKLIESLAINPRPPESQKIEGMTGLYCQEINHSRVIYKIEDQEVLILLVK
jgi:mRNA-degrading endonuclease RelE of RelBE toxin-antitoxin system